MNYGDKCDFGHAQSPDALACTYAALILHDEGLPIAADKIKAIIQAANAPVEAYWPALFASMLQGKNIEELLLSSAAGAHCDASFERVISLSDLSPARGTVFFCVRAAAAPAAAAPAAAGGAAPAAAAGGKKKEPEPEPEDGDDDMGMSLFD